MVKEEYHEDLEHISKHRDRKIEHLKDVSFFKRMAEDCGWDVINEVRS